MDRGRGVIKELKMLNRKELQSARSRLRKVLTPYESSFRQRLLDAKIFFDSQMILGFYILDFAIPSRMLDIEIDGGIHDRPERKEYDVRRNAFVKECGFRVIRIRNEDVETFPIAELLAYPECSKEMFRSALGKANAIRGHALMKHNKDIKHLPPSRKERQKLWKKKDRIRYWKNRALQQKERDENLERMRAKACG